MPRIPFRALLGLALALALAAFASPAGAEDEATPSTLPGSPVTIGVAEAVFVPTTSSFAVVTAVRDAAVEGFWDSVHVAVAAHERAEAEAEAARQRAAEQQASRDASARQAAMAAAPTGSLDEIIARHFGSAAGQARAIAMCESHMNPGAVSRTNDHGLFQINAVHRGQFESVTGQPWSAVYNAEVNTRYAKWLYDQQGWRPWTCRKVL